MHLENHVLRWTSPKSIVIFSKDETGTTINILSGKTCFFRGNLPEDHEAVIEAKRALSEWAETLRTSLGAPSFYSLAHPEYAPILTYLPAGNALSPEDKNSSVTISAVYRKCVYRLTHISAENVTEVMAKK
jgi:hypothetical protein